MGRLLPKAILTFVALTVGTLYLTAQTNYQMDGSPITDCGGFFTDSGGVANNYGTNENFTTTICPDGSGGTHIQLLFPSIDIGPGDSFTAYDSDTADPAAVIDGAFLLFPDNPFFIQASAANLTGCLTLVFTSDGINDGSGWSAAIDCTIACQNIFSRLDSTIPEVMPVDTGWIDICPGDRVTFNGSGDYPQDGLLYDQGDELSEFEWDFGDGNTAVGPNVTHVFDEPGGYVVQLKVVDDRGCENLNFISQRIRVATYPTYQFDGTLDPTICSGDSIMITSSIDTASTSNVSVFPNEGSFTSEGVVSDTLLLPDGSGGVYQSTISFTEFSPGAVLVNPNDICAVSLDLEHSYSGDLDIELICPNGTSIFILDFPSGLGSTNFGEPFASSPVDGNSGDTTPGIPYTYSFVEGAANGTLSVFDNSAPTYTYTTVPSDINGQVFTYTDSYFPGGEYQPEDSYNNLLGCPLNGDWTIRVTDNLGADNGWLFEWSIAFKDYLFPELETFTPTFVDWGWETNPSVISATADSLLASPVNAGAASYTFWVLDDFGCVNDTTLNFEVLPPTHPACGDCGLLYNTSNDTTICEGGSVQLDYTQIAPINQDITFERFPQDPVGFANASPGNPYTSTLNVNSISPAVLLDPSTQLVSVCVNFETDFLADVNLILESPNGIQVPLAIANNGPLNTGYQNTCFTANAAQNINFGTAPFTGEYQPEGNFANFTGSPINGDWNLLITDAFGPLDFGELLQWSITFEYTNEYTYEWTPAAGLTCTDCPTPVATPDVTTTYQLVINPGTNCTATEEVTIEVIPDVMPPVVTCEDQGGDLFFEWSDLPGITQYEYNITFPDGSMSGWMGPITATELLVDNLPNGTTLTLEVRPFFTGNAADCEPPIGSTTCTTDFCDFTVNQPALTDLSCFGAADGQVVFTVEGGTGPFTLTIEGVEYDNLTATGLDAGTFNYMVADAAGCNETGMLTLNQPDELLVMVEQDFISCDGLNESTATATAVGGDGNYTFAWSNSQSNATAIDLAPANYTVTVTDDMGCSAEAAVAIDDLEPITFNFIAEPPTCNGLSDGGLGINQIMGGVGTEDTDYNILWNDGNTEIVRPGVPGGLTYTVTITDAQGCSSMQSRELIDPVPVTFALTTVEPSCNGDTNGSATVVNINGPNGTDFDIMWGPAAANQTTAEAVSLGAGTYTVTVEDVEGCTATESVILDEPSGINLSFSVKDNQCFGDSDGSIVVNAEGGVPGYTFSWPNGSDTQVQENLIAGDYDITVTDANGCTTEATATVAQPVELEANAITEDVSCFGERDGRITIETVGGTPPFQFSVDNENYIGSNVLIGLFADNYNIIIRDANGCQFVTSAVVNEPAQFMVDAGVYDPLIFGDSIDLVATSINAQGDVEFVWSAPYEGTLSCNECPNPMASPGTTIDYELYGIDENGCEDTELLRIFVEKPKLAVVPTGFTPNGDLINDELIVHGRPGTQVLSFQVFDRWGELIYTDENFPVNDATRGWDGTFRNQDMNSGVFVWALVVQHEDGTEETLRGQTTLIR